MEIEFNLRYSPEISDQDIRQRIEQVLMEHQLDFHIDWLLSGKPFETIQGELIEIVSSCIESVTGARPDLSTSGGTSDGRFISPAGVQVVELGPINATIHQINEQTSTADLDQLSTIYENVLERLLTPGS